VSEHVHFPGWLSRQEILKAYGAADLFVSPSHCDGSSISLLEALACGLPVLTSDIPSNLEWVKSSEVGDLFRDGDFNALTKKLLTIADSSTLGQMGEKSRKLAEERADWRKNFQILLSAYQLAYSSAQSKDKS